MDEIKAFLQNYGLSDKEIAVYVACLQLGQASVQTLAKRAGTKRPGTYLILDSLEQKGLVDTLKTRKGMTYRATHPKKIATRLDHLQSDLDSVLPELLAMRHDREDKPVIGVYEDYDVYDRLADEVRTYVETGKEAIYFGNSEHFYAKPDKVRKWYSSMRHRGRRCREIICGDGPVQQKLLADIARIGNPNYQAKLIAKPPHEVATEFAVWGDKVILFSGTGKDLYTITIESPKMVNMFKTIFETMWQSLD